MILFHGHAQPNHGKTLVLPACRNICHQEINSAVDMQRATYGAILLTRRQHWAKISTRNFSWTKHTCHGNVREVIQERGAVNISLVEEGPPSTAAREDKTRKRFFFVLGIMSFACSNGSTFGFPIWFQVAEESGGVIAWYCSKLWVGHVELEIITTFNTVTISVKVLLISTWNIMKRQRC